MNLAGRHGRHGKAPVLEHWVWVPLGLFPSCVIKLGRRKEVECGGRGCRRTCLGEPGCSCRARATTAGLLRLCWGRQNVREMGLVYVGRTLRTGSPTHDGHSDDDGRCQQSGRHGHSFFFVSSRSVLV